MPVETPNVVTAEPEAERLIAAARHTIEEVPFFWVVTPGVEGGAHARIVQAQPSSDGEDFWVRWFLTPPNGRKATEIRHHGRLTLAYQHASGEAFVALSDPAELIDDRDAVNRRFRGSSHDDAKGLVVAGLIAVRVIADHLELHKGGVERLGQCEAAQRLFRKIMDARLAALHIDPADEQHQHPIDAVAVHALRGRASLLTGARLDAELVNLDVPGIGTHRCRGQPIEQIFAGREDRLHRRMRTDRVGDRFEPAFEAAVQRVVVAALVMRLMRLADDLGAGGAKRGKTAAAVAPAIGHVGIDAEIAPAPREAVPIA